jgi:hypothetical protein
MEDNFLGWDWKNIQATHIYCLQCYDMLYVSKCGLYVLVNVDVTKCVMTHIEYVWYKVWQISLEALCIIYCQCVDFPHIVTYLPIKCGHTYYHIRHFIYMGHSAVEWEPLTRQHVTEQMYNCMDITEYKVINILNRKMMKKNESIMSRNLTFLHNFPY